MLCGACRSGQSEQDGPDDESTTLKALICAVHLAEHIIMDLCIKWFAFRWISTVTHYKDQGEAMHPVAAGGSDTSSARVERFLHNRCNSPDQMKQLSRGWTSMNALMRFLPSQVGRPQRVLPP